MRVGAHPFLPPAEREELSFEFEGETYTALRGESIAAALLAAGLRTLRHTEGRGEPRGLYCGIGHCYECRVHLHGHGSVRACTTLVEEGMRVSRARDGEPG